MRMPVMNIRKMRVGMRDACMHVRMRVRLSPIPVEIMFVLVMFIVAMPVGVGQRLVRMRMFMSFAQVQPYADSHQHGRAPEQDGWHFRPERERQRKSEQRRDGEIGACPRATKIA